MDLEFLPQCTLGLWVFALDYVNNLPGQPFLQLVPRFRLARLQYPFDSEVGPLFLTERNRLEYRPHTKRCGGDLARRCGLEDGLAEDG